MVFWFGELPPTLREAIRKHVNDIGSDVAEDYIWCDDEVGDYSEIVAELEAEGKTVFKVSDFS